MLCEMTKLDEDQRQSCEALLPINNVHATVYKIRDVGVQVVPRVGCDCFLAGIKISRSFVAFFELVKDVVKQSLYWSFRPPVLALIEVNVVGNTGKHLVNVLLVWRDVHSGISCAPVKPAR